MPKAVQMQLQMPFFKVSRPFLGPIKMSEVRIPQLSLNFFIDFFFSSLVYLKPQCVLSAEILLEKKKPQPPIMTTVFQFVIFLLFRSSTAEQKKLKWINWTVASRWSGVVDLLRRKEDEEGKKGGVARA